MKKKIYKFNWILLLIISLIGPIILGSISITYMQDSEHFKTNWEIILVSIICLIISIVLSIVISSYFFWLLVKKDLEYITIEINLDNLSKKLLKKVDAKLLTRKNYQKWLSKHNYQYKEVMSNQ